MEWPGLDAFGPGGTDEFDKLVRGGGPDSDSFSADLDDLFDTDGLTDGPSCGQGTEAERALVPAVAGMEGRYARTREMTEGDSALETAELPARNWVAEPETMQLAFSPMPEDIARMQPLAPVRPREPDVVFEVPNEDDDRSSHASGADPRDPPEDSTASDDLFLQGGDDGGQGGVRVDPDALDDHPDDLFLSDEDTDQHDVVFAPAAPSLLDPHDLYVSDEDTDQHDVVFDHPAAVPVVYDDLEEHTETHEPSEGAAPDRRATGPPNLATSMIRDGGGGSPESLPDLFALVDSREIAQRPLREPSASPDRLPELLDMSPLQFELEPELDPAAEPEPSRDLLEAFGLTADFDPASSSRSGSKAGHRAAASRSRWLTWVAVAAAAALLLVVLVALGILAFLYYRP
jgi:hypothetical protein